MGGWLGGWMNGWWDGWMDEWMDRGMGGGWIDRWIVEWVNGQISRKIKIIRHLPGWSPRSRKDVEENTNRIHLWYTHKEKERATLLFWFMVEIKIFLNINLQSVLFLQNKRQAAAYKLITERLHTTHSQPLQPIWKIRSNEPRTQKGDREWEEDRIRCSQIAIKRTRGSGEKK